MPLSTGPRITRRQSEHRRSEVTLFLGAEEEHRGQCSFSNFLRDIPHFMQSPEMKRSDSEGPAKHGQKDQAAKCFD